VRRTIVDIAKEANVSVTTVSLVLNDKAKSMPESTITRIKDIAKKYNYKPNHMAVGLVTKKSKTIGLIVPDITNNFFSELAKSVESYCNLHGYTLILSNSNNDSKKERLSVSLLMDRGIDGLLIAFSQTESMEKQSDFVKLLNKLDIPLVALDSYLEGLTCPGVSVHHSLGGYIATKHLIDLGHKKIACITGPKSFYTAERRLKGYFRALEEHEIPSQDNLVKEGNYSYQSGYDATVELLKNDITAIFVSNDLMAYGAYRAIQEQGKTIPDDISIVGFDDLIFSEILTVPLTTIRQQISELGNKAWDLLYQGLSDGTPTKEYLQLEPKLIIRKSTKNILKEGNDA
jgi:LacI family transcriptional regulator